MTRLLLAASIALLTGTAALTIQAGNTPNPFAELDKKINALQEQLDALPADADAKKKEKMGIELEKLQEKKAETLARMLKPYEQKLEQLNAQKEKLEKQGKPTDKIDKEIVTVTTKIEELEELGKSKSEDKDSDKTDNAPEKASDKGKKALKGMF